MTEGLELVPSPLAQGAFDSIQKPFSIQVLARAVAGALGRRKR